MFQLVAEALRPCLQHSFALTVPQLRASLCLPQSTPGCRLPPSDRPDHQIRAVARLRGLPWSHSAGEVCEFLATIGLKVQPEAVTMLHNAAGEAFITLERQDQLVPELVNGLVPFHAGEILSWKVT